MSEEPSPTRIAAQVASGVGFLGAGVILREGLLGRLIDRRQDTGSEIDVEYRISVTCAAADEAHVRALLLQRTADPPRRARASQSRL